VSGLGIAASEAANVSRCDGASRYHNNGLVTTKTRVKMYTINKGMQRLLPGTSDFHLEETEFRSESQEIKFGLFHAGLYLGALWLRQSQGRIELYIPSVPESNLTRIGDTQFNLDFVEPKV